MILLKLSHVIIRTLKRRHISSYLNTRSNTLPYVIRSLFRPIVIRSPRLIVVSRRRIRQELFYVRGLIIRVKLQQARSVRSLRRNGPRLIIHRSNRVSLMIISRLHIVLQTFLELVSCPLYNVLSYGRMYRLKILNLFTRLTLVRRARVPLYMEMTRWYRLLRRSAKRRHRKYTQLIVHIAMTMILQLTRPSTSLLFLVRYRLSLKVVLVDPPLIRQFKLLEY